MGGESRSMGGGKAGEEGLVQASARTDASSRCLRATTRSGTRKPETASAPGVRGEAHDDG
ncbi:hypothetical protein BOX17_05995 [Halomonas aestuarii]|uniref:Uncharacterized protein n=1 Tax=Halomonas aestuarii TaxID=1897729 RepID=A0A1J0VEY2_9GAMM|nr:hypothetical protein BOX17_05995 [Halomonas aestuarii]